MAVNFAELSELLRYLRHGSFTPGSRHSLALHYLT